MNVLIIGLGSIAKKHIIAIRELYADAIIYALRSSKNSEQFENIRDIFSLEELIVKPDFIIISNPTHLHEEALLKSIEFGCPLFIEKPVLSAVSYTHLTLPTILRV